MRDGTPRMEYIFKKGGRMRANIKGIFPAVLLTLLAGCTTEFQAVNVDPHSGYLPTMPNASAPAKKAEMVTSQKIDLAKYEGRLLIAGGTFFEQETRNIGGFTDIFTFDDLQKRIIAANLQDKVPSVNDLIGLNKAYQNYKPFLFMHFKIETEADNKRYGEIIVTDPGSTQDLMVAQISLCGAPVCENDQDTWYPLFNSYIDWLRLNGVTVGAKAPSAH